MESYPQKELICSALPTTLDFDIPILEKGTIAARVNYDKKYAHLTEISKKSMATNQARSEQIDHQYHVLYDVKESELNQKLSTDLENLQKKEVELQTSLKENRDAKYNDEKMELDELQTRLNNIKEVYEREIP